TSRANEGPDSTAIGASFGSTSANTQDGVESRSGSRPLDTLTTNAPRPILSRARIMTSRTAWDGAADTTTSAPRTAAVRSPTAATAGASAAPGRNMWFTCSRFTLSTTSGSRAHRVTVSKSPFRASRSASAVPHAPPPTTALRVTRLPLSASGTDSRSLAAAEPDVGGEHVSEHRGEPKRDREPRRAVGPGPEDRNRDGALDHVDHADGNRVRPAEHAVHIGGAEVVGAVLAQVDALPEPAGDVARRRGADQVGEEEHDGQPEVVHPRAVSRLRRSFRLSGEPVNRHASRKPFTR